MQASPASSCLSCLMSAECLLYEKVEKMLRAFPPPSDYFRRDKTKRPAHLTGAGHKRNHITLLGRFRWIQNNVREMILPKDRAAACAAALFACWGRFFSCEVIIQAGCSEVQNPAQTSSSSKNAGPFCELKKAKAFLISQKGPAMFFSRRWMLCSGNERVGQPAYSIS